jgi:hypothetical protein
VLVKSRLRPADAMLCEVSNNLALRMFSICNPRIPEPLGRGVCQSKNGSVVLVGTYSHPTGEPENEVILFTWDSEGIQFSVKITEAGLDAAVPVGCALTLIDSEGDYFTIELWSLKIVPVKIDW